MATPETESFKVLGADVISTGGGVITKLGREFPKKIEGAQQPSEQTKSTWSEKEEEKEKE